MKLIRNLARPVVLAAAFGCGAAEVTPALTHEQAEVLRRATAELIRESIPRLSPGDARDELTRALSELSGSLDVLPTDSLSVRIVRLRHVLSKATTHPADSVHAAKIALLLERAHTLGRTESTAVRRQP